jgi:serine/threonine-protein kinase
MAHLDARLTVLRDHLLGSPLAGTGGVSYYLRELIGEGGQGWVYKANYDEPEGIWVVVKVLRPDSVTQETLIRFRREAEVLRMLGSQPTPNPNVVRFYDHGIATVELPVEPRKRLIEMPFTVLEYVDGVTLGRILEGPPRCSLPVERVRRVLRQVVRALESVHAHRVVHRDLKPSNILLTKQAGTEVAKVTDFGLVKITDLKVTQTATVAGASLGYAPPEQYEQGNERVSPRTDVFSLATILFEALAGREAFPYKDGENPLRVISRLLTGPRPSIAAAGGVLSAELQGQEDLLAALDREIGRATMPDPDARHGSCRELWDAVEPVLKTAHRRSTRAAKKSGFEVTAEAPAVDLEARAAEPPKSRRGRRSAPMPNVPPAPATCAASAEHASALIPAEAQKVTLRALGGPIRGASLRCALIGGDGSIMAIGPAGLYRWAANAWSVLPVPAGLDPRAVRAMARTPDGCLLLCGERGLVAKIGPTGAQQALAGPSADATYLGAWVHGPSMVVLVGERLSRPGGLVATFEAGAPPRSLVVDWATRLTAVACTAGGALIACGDAGALLRLDPSSHTPLPWARTGHLRAIAPLPNGGAAVVGTGGHALSITRELGVSLEAVQTTRDLTAVCVGADGAPWAAGAAGRVLRRSGATWVRVAPEAQIVSDLVALGCTSHGLVALGEDGLVVEVRQAP